MVTVPQFATQLTSLANGNNKQSATLCRSKKGVKGT